MMHLSFRNYLVLQKLQSAFNSERKWPVVLSLFCSTLYHNCSSMNVMLKNAVRYAQYSNVVYIEIQWWISTPWMYYFIHKKEELNVNNYSYLGYWGLRVLRKLICYSGSLLQNLGVYSLSSFQIWRLCFISCHLEVHFEKGEGGFNPWNLQKCMSDICTYFIEGSVLVSFGEILRNVFFTWPCYYKFSQTDHPLIFVTADAYSEWTNMSRLEIQDLELILNPEALKMCL